MGHSAFDGQSVHRDHVLTDGDVVEIHGSSVTAGGLGRSAAGRWRLAAGRAQQGCPAPGSPGPAQRSFCFATSRENAFWMLWAFDVSTC